MIQYWQHTQSSPGTIPLNGSAHRSMGQGGHRLREIQHLQGGTCPQGLQVRFELHPSTKHHQQLIHPNHIAYRWNRIQSHRWRGSFVRGSLSGYAWKGHQLMRKLKYVTCPLPQCTHQKTWNVDHWQSCGIFVDIGCLCTSYYLMWRFLVIISAVSFQGWSGDLWLLCYTVSLCLLCL